MQTAGAAKPDRIGAQLSGGDDFGVLVAVGFRV